MVVNTERRIAVVHPWARYSNARRGSRGPTRCQDVSLVPSRQPKQHNAPHRAHSSLM